jgi:methylthioribose-1-phosphate isomerase
MESPLFWPAQLKGKTLFVLDETQLPSKLVYLKVPGTREAVDCIRKMKTRAFGQFLVVLNTFLLEIRKSQRLSHPALLKKIIKTAESLNASRPTFPFSEVTSVVVHWAKKASDEKTDIAQVVSKNIYGYLAGIRVRRMDRVKQIAFIIKNRDTVLTHCNVSGELAMAAVLCKKQGKKVHFFATETRPYFQGAKLTCWELKKVGAEVTLIADNAVGSLLADGVITKVIVGSDRNCANGDFANKIGTYQIAVLAKEFGVPFYVLTQPSKKIRSGKDIPIEMRSEEELLSFKGRKIIAGHVRGLYPAFDVVPRTYITGGAIAINVN